MLVTYIHCPRGSWYRM